MGLVLNYDPSRSPPPNPRLPSRHIRCTLQLLPALPDEVLRVRHLDHQQLHVVNMVHPGWRILAGGDVHGVYGHERLWRVASPGKERKDNGGI